MDLPGIVQIVHFLVPEELLALYGDLSINDLSLLKNHRHFSAVISQLTSVKETWRIFSEGKLNFGIIFFTGVPCILILSKYFIYQLMHSRVALKEY